MLRVKCLAILWRLNTAPAASPIRSAPRSGLFFRLTALATLARSASVAASRSCRLRARSAASSGLRHTTRRSPGNSGELTSARACPGLDPGSRSSNKDNCNAPCSASALMELARSAVIQPSPAGFSTVSMRASVIMPSPDLIRGSPMSTTRLRWKHCLSLATWLATVVGSAVLPSKTSTATGQPSPAHSRPKTICGRSRLPSRLTWGILRQQLSAHGAIYTFSGCPSDPRSEPVT